MQFVTSNYSCPKAFLCRKCLKMKKSITYRYILGKARDMCDLCWKKFFVLINLNLLKNIYIKNLS